MRTGQAQAAQATKDTSGFLTIFQDFLLAFGGIALFVGSFVIANTLSITIAQRTRELATLRTLGATRRQVLSSVMLEALVIGVLASVVGLFLGLGLAKGLNSLLVSFGIDLPQAGTVFKTRTIVISLVVGVVITLLAALRPAIRSTRVPPIAAVREGAVLPPSRFARFGVYPALRDDLRVGRADADRPVRGWAVYGRAAAVRRGGGAGAVHRRRNACAAAGAAARRRAGVAGDEDRGSCGDARPEQFDAQPGPDRVHRLRADDRAHARHAGRRPGGRAEVTVRGGDQPAIRGQLRDHGHEQLHADQHRVGAGGPPGAGGHRRLGRACGGRQGVRFANQRHRR